MSTTWEERIEELHKLPETTKKGGKNWVSLHYKDLLEKIYKKAIEWEISPNIIKKKRVTTKIWEIVPEATKARNNNDKDRLVYLFELVDEMSTAKLRNHLRTKLLPKITVKEIQREGDKRFLLDLDGVQFHSICRSLEVMYVFEIEQDTTESS